MRKVISLWRKTYLDVFMNGRDKVDVAANLDRRTPPGIEFRYRFPGTHVLSAVIRGAYGDELPYTQIVEEKLWVPSASVAMSTGCRT